MSCLFLLFLPIFTQQLEEVSCEDYNITKYSCSGKCFISSDSKKPVCLNDAAQGYCSGPRTYFIVTIIAFWVPIIICLILRYACLKEMRPPLISYIYDFIIILSIIFLFDGMYCIVTTNETVPSIVFIMIGFLIFVVFPFFVWCSETKCCCTDPKNFPHYIRKYFKQKLYQKSACETIITEARQNPPIIQIIGNQHIYHRRQKSTWIEVIPVENDTVPYNTWEERGELVTIPKCDTVVIDMSLDIYKSAELQEVQKEKWFAMEETLKSRNYEKYSVEEVDYVDKYVNTFLVSLGDTACCVNCALSCCGRCCHHFLHLIGYHSVFETIWCFYVGLVNVKLEKYVDDADTYRTHTNEKDLKANTYVYDAA